VRRRIAGGAFEDRRAALLLVIESFEEMAYDDRQAAASPRGPVQT